MLNTSMVYAMDEVKTERSNLFVLALMYIGFWTNVIETPLITPSILPVFQALTLLVGFAYFSFLMIRKWDLNHLEIHFDMPANRLGLITLILWFVLGLSIILSEIVRGTSPHVGVMYFLYVPIFFFYIIPSSLKTPIYTVCRAVLISGVIVILLSLVTEFPTIGVRYEGITNNPNSLGMVANQTVLAAASLFYMEFQKKKFKKRKLTLYSLAIVMGLLPLMVSESRTSFLVVAVGLFVIFVHAVLTKRLKLKHLVALLMLFLVVYNAFLADFFQAGIAARISSYAGSDRVLAGRTDIWRNIIQNASMFGYGFDYFSQYIQIQAHNDVLQFIGMYGIPSGIILGVFYVLVTILGLEFSINKMKKEYAIIPLVFIIGYIALGSAESVIGFNAKTPVMVFFNIVGILLLENNDRK